MKVFLYVIFATLVLSLSITAQTTPTQTTAATTDAKPKRQIFRANKDQIKQVQKDAR